MMKKKQLIVICSGYNNRQEVDYTNDMKAVIKNELAVTTIDCKGCYNGTKENSFIVICNSMQDVYTIRNIACTLYEQESIFISYPDRSSQLMYSNGLCEDIGILKQVWHAEDNYTLVNDSYWVTN